MSSRSYFMSPTNQDDKTSRGRTSARGGATEKEASSRISEYVTGRTIGVGSSGKVKLAKHKATGNTVAIKILDRAKLLAKDGSEAKVNLEIDILARARHRNIIGLYDVITTPSHVYIVLEHVAGGELFDYIVAKGRLPERKARYLFQQIISAVAYCHSKGITHRDLKPENILMTSEQIVKLADFGYSRTLKDGVLLRTSCGSPNYAAPELLSASEYAGPEVDIWSCGVILYTLICAKLPFDDPYDNMRNLFRLIRKGAYTVPGYVSANAKALLARMLVVNPLHRASMQEIIDHPWMQNEFHILDEFVGNPMSLVWNGRVNDDHDGLIDMDLIGEVCRTYGKDAVEAKQLVPWVQLGSRLFIEDRFKLNWTAKRLVVCYRMLYAQGMAREDAISSSSDKTPLRRTSGSQLSKLAGHVAKEDLSRISSTSISRVASRVRLETLELLPDIESQTGIVVMNLDANQIMLVLFDVLKSLNYEWKVMSHYHIKARTFYNLPGAVSGGNDGDKKKQKPRQPSVGTPISRDDVSNSRLSGMRVFEPSASDAPNMSAVVEDVEGKHRETGEREEKKKDSGSDGDVPSVLKPSEEPVLRISFQLYQLPDSRDQSSDAQHVYVLDLRMLYGLPPTFLNHASYFRAQLETRKV